MGRFEWTGRVGSPLAESKGKDVTVSADSMFPRKKQIMIGRIRCMKRGDAGRRGHVMIGLGAVIRFVETVV